jgi:hypothetical protein
MRWIYIYVYIYILFRKSKYLSFYGRNGITTNMHSSEINAHPTYKILNLTMNYILHRFYKKEYWKVASLSFNQLSAGSNTEPLTYRPIMG